MSVRIIVKIVGFFCFVIGLPVLSNPVAKNWEVFSSLQKSEMSGQLWHEDFEVPVELDLALDKEPTTANGVLSLFYGYAKLNQLEKMAQLMYTPDGSRQRFSDFIADNPGAYRRFSAVTSAALTYRIDWGVYQNFGIIFRGRRGEMNWQDAVVCENKRCWISNFLFDGSPDSDLFHNLSNDFLESTSTAREKNNPIAAEKGAITFSLLPPGSGSNFRDRKLYPIRIFLNIKNYPDGSYFSKASGAWVGAADIDSLSQTFADFVKAVWALDGDQIDVENSDPIEKVLSQHWEGYQKRRLIPLIDRKTVDPTTSIKNDNDPVDEVAEYSRVEYFPAVLYETINRWTEVQILGSIAENNVKYLFFRPYVQNEPQPVQFVPLEAGIGTSPKLSATLLTERSTQMLGALATKLPLQVFFAPMDSLVSKSNDPESGK